MAAAKPQSPHDTCPPSHEVRSRTSQHRPVTLAPRCLATVATHHVVCEDAAVAAVAPQAHHALEHELHALPLVGPQELSQHRVHTDWLPPRAIRRRPKNERILFGLLRLSRGRRGCLLGSRLLSPVRPA